MRAETRALGWVCAVLGGLAACGGTDGDGGRGGGGAGSAAPWLVEVAAESGIDFVHVRGREQRYWFPEIAGSGLAFLDYDGDGWLDLYAVQAGDLRSPEPELVNRLYRNRGDGTFEDVTDEAGAADPGYGMGCTVGDSDGDGDVDLYVTNVGPNALFRNAGDGTFDDVTDAAGVGDRRWGTSCAFLDHDEDGDLDLFVVNYLNWSPDLEIECRSAYERDYCGPTNYNSPAQDVLYRNEGDGTFTDVSVAAGLQTSFGNGLGVAVGDFDDDGRLDVYVANDLTPNQLWINGGDGTFEDRALLSGCAANMSGAVEAGMGAVAFDLEDDGDLDLFLTHLRKETNTLYRNEGGQFSDWTVRTGLASPSLEYTGFGVGLFDFDQDGRLDCYVANGRVARHPPHPDPDDPYAEPDQLFRGVAEGRFQEIPERLEPALRTGRGAAFGDYDNDGDVDVAVLDAHAPLRLLRNVATPRGHAIQLRVLDGVADALGASVQVARRWRSVQVAASYCAANDPRVHVGLGDAAAPVEALVIWLDGARERFGPLEVDRLHELRRGTGRPER